MYNKFMLFALLLGSVSLQAQEQQTLFQHARLTGAFGGPIYTYIRNNDANGFGAGGGGGLVFDRVFVGAFGMGERFDPDQAQNDRLDLAYGGLWVGYTYPTHKLVHLYTSVKLGGGAVGPIFQDDYWDWDSNRNDAVWTFIPEAGVELNVARWFRISGSAGYRMVQGFNGFENFGKNDLNAPVFALTMRFGWFGSGKKSVR